VPIELVQWPAGHPDGMTQHDPNPGGSERGSQRTAKNVFGEIAVGSKRVITLPSTISW
jgi:hypothetical protein